MLFYLLFLKYMPVYVNRVRALVQADAWIVRTLVYATAWIVPTLIEAGLWLVVGRKNTGAKK